MYYIMSVARHDVRLVPRCIPRLLPKKKEKKKRAKIKEEQRQPCWSLAGALLAYFTDRSHRYLGTEITSRYSRASLDSMISEDNTTADRAAPVPSGVSQSLLGPRVDVQILFDRYTHSYSQNEPPKITLRLISRAVSPITILMWRTPFDIKTALVTNGFHITDKRDGHRVRTTSIQIQRPALHRTRGGPDDKHFITLLPGEPFEISAGKTFHPSHHQLVKPLLLAA